MIPQPSEYLEKLFVCDVRELHRLQKIAPAQLYHVLQMSSIIRRLTIDEQPLAKLVASNCISPLMVLHPEAISGNPNYETNPKIPGSVLDYAPKIDEKHYPGGQDAYFLRVYTLDEYLNDWQMILPINGKGRKIIRKEMIKYFANKLGGVHTDKRLRDDRRLDAESLHIINTSVSVYGQPALMQQFYSISASIFRACAPLSQELFEKYNKNIELTL